MTAEDHGPDPEYPAKDVEQEIAQIRHAGSPRHGRAKGADDGDEPREDDSSAAVLLVEIMGALQVTATEEERVFSAIKGGTGAAADPVADLVAYDGRSHDREE